MTTVPSGTETHDSQSSVRAPSTVATYFVELLEDAGVDRVYTVPGGTLLPILEALGKSPCIRTVCCKDESGAAAAADGHAWATDGVSVVLTIGGPGVTNALTGIGASALQRNPVLLVSGEVATTMGGLRAAQDSTCFGVNATAMSRPATALSVECSSAEQAAFALEEALRRAIRLRRPVHVAIPLDVQRAHVLPRSSRKMAVPQHVPRGVASEALADAAAILRRCERIALLVGGGARRAGPEIVGLADRIGAPIATTCSGKGIVPEYHPLSIGVFSLGGSPLARDVLTSRLDALIAVGTGLGEFATMNYSDAIVPDLALVHIDEDPVVFDRRYKCFPLCGDAAEAVRGLAGGLDERPAPIWTSSFLSARSRFSQPDALHSGAVPIRPERLVHEIELALPPESRVLADIGTSCLFVAHCMRLRPGQRSYIPMGWSCMGHPIAAALGVRLGSGLPTVCVAGDGAFLSKGLEIHTAVEQGVSGLIYVVLSNGGHALVRMGTLAVLGPTENVEMGSVRVAPDIARIARGLGAEGLRVDAPDDIATALQHGLNCGRPCVIDVRVDPDARPPMEDRIQNIAGTVPRVGT
ncbi:MAG TPA: thiamine pyrophosphate-binding protein [Polyangiaceae bacterium]|nr:thiamine pyrophosphate-binding protein [Polyangiaceae bacterium]